MTALSIHQTTVGMQPRFAQRYNGAAKLITADARVY